MSRRSLPSLQQILAFPKSSEFTSSFAPASPDFDSFASFAAVRLFDVDGEPGGSSRADRFAPVRITISAIALASSAEAECAD